MTWLLWVMLLVALVFVLAILKGTGWIRFRRCRHPYMEDIGPPAGIRNLDNLPRAVIHFDLVCPDCGERGMFRARLAAGTRLSAPHFFDAGQLWIRHGPEHYQRGNR